MNLPDPPPRRLSYAMLRDGVHHVWGWLREREPVVLLLAFGIAMACWALVELSDEVLEQESLPLDTYLLEVWRDPQDPGKLRFPSWVEDAARDFTSLGGYPVVMLVVAGTVGFLALANRKGEALFVMVAVVSGGLVTHLFKTLVARPRPSLVPHLVDIHSLSFPSGHSVMSTVVYITLATLLAAVVSRTRLKLYLLAVGIGVALLVGSTRVILGVHYPTDVLAGWCAGFAWAGLCWLVFRWLQWSHWMKIKEPEEVLDGD